MTCYLCGNRITDENRHNEHIIPNGIAGKLQSDKILHEKCGEALGADIDNSFAKKFALVLNLFDVKRDRGEAPAAKIVVNVNGHDIKCLVDKGRILIGDCYVDEINKRVYCSPKQEKNLTKKYGADYCYITGFDVESLDEKYLESVASLSPDDRMGLIKIAVEFALLIGIKIEILEHAFDVGAKEFKDAVILPYHPENLFERFIEETKWFFEKQRIGTSKGTVINPEHPTHSLHLFNIDSKLYCFVSLFSFFEFYVLLSESYKGQQVSDWHFESVVKSQPYVSEYDLRNEDPKSIHICAQHWGTSCACIQDRIRKSKVTDPQNVGILRKTFVTAYKKSNPESYMAAIVDNAARALLLRMAELERPDIVSRYIPDEIKAYLNLLVKNKEDSFNIISGSRHLYYPLEESDCFDLGRYKTSFTKDGRKVFLPEEIELNLAALEGQASAFRLRQLKASLAVSELLMGS